MAANIGIMKATTITGRATEQAILQEALSSGNAELIALYGRRRVGKTHLAREFLTQNCQLYFSVTGEKDASKAIQLENFYREMVGVFGEHITRPKNWRAALLALTEELENTPKRQKVGIFLDELPWLATHRSGFLQALDHLWNTRLSLLPNLSLVVCGSAASWMLNNLVHAKGGLYNRVTRRICLLPFSLSEAQEFLADRKIKLNRTQVTEVYLCFGGIPHYLMQIRKGQSAAQAISEACFSPNGILSDEYKHLFASLFNESEVHSKIIEAVAKKRGGLSRNEIIKATKVSTGGRLATRLDELEASGFLARVETHGYTKREPTYRIIDEYILFYLKWIRSAPKSAFKRAGSNYWFGVQSSPAYRAWAGNSFEALCFKHIENIQKKLGVESLVTGVGSWRYIPKKGQKESRGIQVDMLFDRRDGVIQLCEIKYSNETFVISKDYARQLAHKLQVFEEHTKTKKQIQLVLICAHGMKQNIWSEDLVDAVVVLEDLFL